MAGPERHPKFVVTNFAKEPCMLYIYTHAQKRYELKRYLS